MIEKARNEIKELLGKRVVIKINLGRNKEDIYEGIIKSIYHNVFLVNNRCFSYIDIITKDIIVKKL